jgi:hypothetical protein
MRKGSSATRCAGSASTVPSHGHRTVTVLDCPHEAAATELITTAVADTKVTATITQTVIATEEQAQRRGFTGSPTILRNGPVRADGGPHCPRVPGSTPPPMAYEACARFAGPVPSAQAGRRKSTQVKRSSGCPPGIFSCADVTQVSNHGRLCQSQSGEQPTSKPPAATIQRVTVTGSP